MAYGKDDFVNFSDLDLDFILEEYTCSEVDTDDDDNVSRVPSVKLKNVDKIYQCDKCEKTYASISGLRGHLRTKHGISKVRVSDYRPNSTTKGSEMLKPFKIEQEDFKLFFRETFSETLVSMTEHKRSTLSSNRKLVIKITESIINNNDAQDKLACLLCDRFQECFEKANDTDNSNEGLFTSFQQILENDQIFHEIENVASTTAVINNARQFVGVLLHKLIRTLVEKRASLFESVNENQPEISENDQSVLFYISGFIVHSLLKRKITKSKSAKITALQDALRDALITETSSQRTFVSKHAEWTKMISRGGLKIPSDTFFLLIRECEQCCREHVGAKCNSHSLERIRLTELIMDRYMVKFYSEKIFKGPYSNFMLESCVKLFLTIRGHAWARKRRNDEYEDPNQTKALRKSLQEYTNFNK